MSELVGESSNVHTHVCLQAWDSLWVIQHSLLQKRPVSLVVMGLESSDGSHVAFQGKKMGPPAHWVEEKSSGTSIMEMQNTQWRSGTMQRHFIHSSGLSPFSGRWGEHEETAIPEKYTGVMWESSALSLAPAETLSTGQSSFVPLQLVFKWSSLTFSLW